VSEPSGFDARELFAALAKHAVAYVTVGGIAIQAHGGQRLTQDLDITVDASTENLQRLAAALDDLDARMLGPDGQRSRSTPTAALLGASDQWHLMTAHGALDVMTLPAHLGSFGALRERAHETPLGDLIVPVASRNDLLEMKRTAGRPHDLEDVRLLEALEDEPSA
jgi:hypothetical protein